LLAESFFARSIYAIWFGSFHLDVKIGANPSCIFLKIGYKMELQFMNRREVKTMLFAPKEKAQGLVEYALILVLVAVVVIVILALLGPAIGNIFSNIMRAI
jgi:pilus assembly protein Flp/PilA